MTRTELPDPRVIVLVVDDEEDTRGTNAAILNAGGFETITARDADEALGILRSRPAEIPVVLLDIKMPDRRRTPERAGLELLPEIRDVAPDALVVLFSVVDDVQATIEALQHGRAFDYLIKNHPSSSNQAVVNAVRRACEHRRLRILERRTSQEILHRLLSAVVAQGPAGGGPQARRAGRGPGDQGRGPRPPEAGAGGDEVGGGEGLSRPASFIHKLPRRRRSRSADHRRVRRALPGGGQEAVSPPDP